MPLDGHGYLVKHGWKGGKNPLRTGGISRPIIQAQKKDLGGVGKNRDDGFEFWDHIYAAAASNIKINVDVDDDHDEEKPNKLRIGFTQTGLLSNQRPCKLHHGKPGAKTDVLHAAKREAAKRRLYSKFYSAGMLITDEPLKKKRKTKQ